MKDIVGIRDLSREDIDLLINDALELKQNKSTKADKKFKVASLFFETSTRTRMSFETAAEEQGMFASGFSGAEGTSVKKGEPISDTLRMFEGYGYDVVVMRHNLDGAARLAADILKISVINAGDGQNAHPTQTLLDLMTIKELKGSVDGLKIALVGDLKYGRTVHSLFQALELYFVELWLVAPESLQMPKWRVDEFVANTGKNVILKEDLKDVIPHVDILYMTRIQRERFPESLEGELEYKKVSGLYNLTAAMLKQAKQSSYVLHPLPRYKHNLEIAMDVDTTKHAGYFVQAQNGLFMRQAILKRVLGEGFRGVENAIKEVPLWQDLPIGEGSKKGEHLIYRLDNGTLIDHVEQGKGLQVFKILGLDGCNDFEVVPALNINSGKFGKKDVIAVHNVTLSPEQLFKVALVSERATVNLIQNNTVVKKGKVTPPEIIAGLVRCGNPHCVSREEHKEHLVSKFQVIKRQPLIVRCHYCERSFKREEFELEY
ncbi:hypothetical protein COV18_03040 [Candidatus Woesearchaeota archaeon CG10_big_fil_rev_8_21_14_0_10_37_12]|nr:MAG: hypothetical protein COV18_03040 [Candidatus Woesearchaeota archaeon CG10_big_fil_rev_8_21_14_0_10_37_12]